MEADFIYFSRRAQEEREAAMRNPHPDARRAHIDMARRYDDLARAIEVRHQVFSGRAVTSR